METKENAAESQPRVLSRGIRRTIQVRWPVYLVLAATLSTVGCSFGKGQGKGGGGHILTSGPLSLPVLSSFPAGCFSAAVGANFTCQITASGGTLPYTWKVKGLPSGLSSSTSINTMTVTVSGAATSQDIVGGRATSYTVTVCVTDAALTQVCLGSQNDQFQISVSLAQGPGPLTITTQNPLPNASVGTAYLVNFTSSGGTIPYNYSLASGSAVPAGLSLASDGGVSGTPTAAGTYQFTIQVADSSTPPQTASANFTLTVSAISTGCSTNPGLTLCGLYWFGVRGFDENGAPTAMGGAFTVDSSGNFSGEAILNDSANGFAQMTVTGGSFTMDPSRDGRGLVTLNSSNGAIATFRFVLGGAQIPIEEFENSGPRVGTRAEGFLIGPEIAPITSIPAGTDLALGMLGANGANQKAGLLGLFTIGANGCDGSNGSFNSLEPFVTNTAGKVNTGLTATGSCTASDANGIGTAQFTISGGTPYTKNTLQFTYIIATNSNRGLQAILFLEEDAVGTNQPLLVAFGAKNTFFGLSFGGLGPCLFSEQGTIDGTVNPHTAIASITRFTPTGTTETGTLSGVIDQNAAGTATTQAAWAYTSYSVDGNGVGTLSGAGQNNIDVVLGGAFFTMDESSEVRTGILSQQNFTALEAGSVLRSATGGPATSGPGDMIGVIGFTGAAAGTFSGAVDWISGKGAFPGASLSGAYGAPNYASIDSTTGRGTGNITLTSGANSSSTNVVVYAERHAAFLMLDMQSNDPDVEVVQ